MNQEIAKRIKTMVDDRSSGAHKLTVDALKILLAIVEDKELTSTETLRASLRNAANQLAAARPSMVSVKNVAAHAVSTVLAELHPNRNLAENVKQARATLRGIIDDLERSSALLVGHAHPLFTIPKTVLTHSYSSTVKATISRYRASVSRVILTESRPKFEGRKLAFDLARAGIDVTLVTDAAAPRLAREADIFLVGADSILSDGSLVNKVGTYPIALAAATARIPLYTLAETWKIGYDINPAGFPLEEKSPVEVLARTTLDNLRVRNIYFDITPPRLIKGIVTERGIIRPAQIRRLQ